LYLIDNENFPFLLGRDWFQKFQLPWSSIHSLNQHDDMKFKNVLSEFPDLSKPGIGKIPGTKVRISLKPNATPVYFRPRPIPASLRTPIEDELAYLESQDIIEKVNFSNWATPLVPRVKK